MYVHDYKNWSHRKCLGKNIENTDVVDVTESSSSDASPCSIIPSADLTMDKEIDTKSLKQNLYDLKLRIYYMEQKKKYLEDDDGSDIYQKYIDLQAEFEKLTKNVDEKDDLLLKAQKVTSYLREEKEKMLYEFQEKEKFYKEHIQQLEKELEEIKLCNPKFGLHSTMFMSGDSANSFTTSFYKGSKRISEMEYQNGQLNMELESLKATNDQLEQTIRNLQRKINLYNKEISELNKELISVQKQRDLAIDTCAKRDEVLNELERQRQELEERLIKVEHENESLRVNLNLEQPQNSNSITDKAAAAIIQRLLIENKQVNNKLRQVKEDLLQLSENCSGCPTCISEKKLRKNSVLSLRQKSTAGTSEDENDMGLSASATESEGELEKYSRINDHQTDLKHLLREKDELIKQLKAELKKRTYNLQELVNKELWDKNREIEKLNKVSEKRKKENDLLKKQLACDSRISSAMRELQPCSVRDYKDGGKENIASMSDDVKMLKENLRYCLEEKKALLDKITKLESKIINDQEQKSQASLINNLRLECVKRKDDFEESEKARKEAFNACALLTNRLEELACFLESLLLAHDVNGMNSKKRQLLKQAIERSREISKSFSCTFNYPDNISTTATKFESSVDLSVPILPDCSEINLSFSGGDDEYDVNETIKPDEGVSVFGRMIKSSEFYSEESDQCVVGKRSISFVNDLNASNELVFSTEGVKRLDDEDGDYRGDDNNDGDNNTGVHDVTDSNAVERKSNKMCDDALPPNAVTASSAIVSLDEAFKIRDFDSESEAWSEPDRNVSAARIGLINSAEKVRVKRLRPEQRSNTDTDVSNKSAKKYSDVVEVRQMQKRIQQLEKINESLRKDLKCLRFSSENSITSDKKTDMEKLSEKTKFRNLLNKIKLENCVDTKKYRDAVEVVRKHLRELSKHLYKTNKFDRFISLKLKEISEHFELSELCCSKLGHHLEESKTRCNVLTELLEETQSKFEQVMVDLRTTKLAYNSVILEHEQNIFKYKQSELTNEQLREKLKTVDELCRSLEEAKNQRFDSKSCSCELLKDMLEKASQRIAELEIMVTANDKTFEELATCKQNLNKLTEENEKLLSDLEQLSTCKTKIEEYEKQLSKYKENCEKLELELFEKEDIERMCKQQCVKLEEEIAEKNTLDRSLKLAHEELEENRIKIDQLERTMRQLKEQLEEKERSVFEQDRQLLVLKNEADKSALLLEELKSETERDISEKTRTIADLKELLKLSDDKTKKFENEIEMLKNLLKTCEEEKQEFRHKMMAQFEEHENLKRQHERKMKHLLDQIVVYRAEEESSLAAHRQLVEQIEEAQNKKELWKMSIQEWKEKYEELKREKDIVEDKLLRSNGGDVRCEMKTSNEQDESRHEELNDTKVHHLENIKNQLEKRVRELETANRELEVRLKRLQTTKVNPSDFDLTSEESSRATSPAENFLFDFGYPRTNSSTGYSSSLPTSPQRRNKRPSSPLACSAPSSPGKQNFVPNIWLKTDSCAVQTFEDTFYSHDTIEATPARKFYSGNSATSPDLGIDSDHGRNSSFEFDSGNGEIKIRSEIVNLEEENKHLKRELGQTKKELEETLGKLTMLNKNKKRMEKAIFKQIFETKHILKRARVNLEDENSESAKL